MVLLLFCTCSAVSDIEYFGGRGGGAEIEVGGGKGTGTAARRLCAVDVRPERGWVRGKR